jgi:EAL domain-containing protein (putative c-di-GMP-specific phosphodiesterase class I)
MSSLWPWVAKNTVCSTVPEFRQFQPQPRQQVAALQHLRDRGVLVVVDDFGTGYSSLAYLTTLPISELKIDRSFVRDLGVTPQSSAVVTAIIALARSLGLRVVAEGVETEEELAKIRLLGCKKIQGYYFGRPMTAHDATALFDTLEWRRQQA